MTSNTTKTAVRLTALEGEVASIKGDVADMKAMLTKALSSSAVTSTVTEPQAEKASKGKAKAKAEEPTVKFSDLRLRLKEHKAAGAIQAGISVRQAIEAGLMTETGDLPGAVAEPKKAKKGKKAKKQAEAQVVTAKIEASEPAFMSDEWITKAHPSQGPRDAKGHTTAKRTWKLREYLAETGEYDRHEIDAHVASILG